MGKRKRCVFFLYFAAILSGTVNSLNIEDYLNSSFFENIDDMEMEVEISYLDLFVFTNHAISPNELRNDLYQYKIKIKDKEDILDFIYRCRKIELLPAENVGGPINVRCCIDFYFYGMKKFSYSLGAFGTHIIIGNTLFENDDVFYDFVYEYLPRKEMKYINDLLELKKSGKLP